MACGRSTTTFTNVYHILRSTSKRNPPPDILRSVLGRRSACRGRHLQPVHAGQLSSRLRVTAARNPVAGYPCQVFLSNARHVHFREGVVRNAIGQIGKGDCARYGSRRVHASSVCALAQFCEQSPEAKERFQDLLHKPVFVRVLLSCCTAILYESTQRK